MAQKSSVRLLLWIAVIGIVILMLAVVGAVVLMDDGPSLLSSEEDRWLEAKLGGTLNDAPGTEGLLVDPANLPPLTSEIAETIRDAANDDSIVGMRIEVRPVAGGWGQLTEIRDALVAFGDSGKPCTAWAEALTTKEYYLASACGEVMLPPAGVSMVNGFSSTQTYYAGTFEKVGISPNFEHVGDFKTGPEPYERSEPSEAAIESMNVLLDSFYTQFLETVAQGRGLDPEEVHHLVNAAPMTPQDALEAGLIDGIGFRDEVFPDKSDDDHNGVAMKRYLNDRRAAWGRGGDTIAVVHADGTIVSGSSEQGVFGGKVIGDRTVRKQLRDLAEDDKVKAVVLRINSPGGSGGASDAMWREIKQLREKKPVVASMADVAASGGYYMAMAADKIVAQPNTVTGSIGVFGGKMNFGGLYEKVGMSTYTYERGDLAGLFSNTEDFSDAERARFRTYLQTFYDLFLERAAEDRPLSVEQLHEVAQGRVWTGTQALERQLVDELGGLDAAVAAAAELAAVDEYHIRRIPERKGFLDTLIEEMQNPGGDDFSAHLAHLSPEVQQALQTAWMLDQVLTAGGVAALMPWVVDD